MHACNMAALTGVAWWTLAVIAVHLVDAPTVILARAVGTFIHIHLAQGPSKPRLAVALIAIDKVVALSTILTLGTGTIVDIHLTAHTDVARLAGAAERVDAVDAIASVQTDLRGTIINVPRAGRALKALGTLAQIPARLRAMLAASSVSTRLRGASVDFLLAHRPLISGGAGADNAGTVVSDAVAAILTRVFLGAPVDLHLAASSLVARLATTLKRIKAGKALAVGTRVALAEVHPRLAGGAVVPGWTAACEALQGIFFAHAVVAAGAACAYREPCIAGAAAVVVGALAGVGARKVGAVAVDAGSGQAFVNVHLALHTQKPRAALTDVDAV